MGLDLPVTPPPPLTSFTGCRSRTLMSFLIRRQADRITLIFWACLSMPNYFVATFAFGWPTDPIVANILIALPIALLTALGSPYQRRPNGSTSEIRSTPICFDIIACDD